MKIRTDTPRIAKNKDLNPKLVLAIKIKHGLLVSLWIAFILLIAGACAQLWQTPPPSETPETDTRPNIIFILTDDLDEASLPYASLIDHYIASQGARLTHYFINVPQCCPSRATTLVGQYSHNTGVYTNGGYAHGGFRYFRKLGLEQKTIAVALQNSGYRTALMGKYLNGFPVIVRKLYIPDGWDEWYVPVVGNPYSSYNYMLNDNGKITEFKDAPEDYLTDVLASRANDFIRRTASPGQPFFLYLAPYAPHGPSTPARRHASFFQEVSLPRSPSFNETDVSDKPQFIRALHVLTPQLEQRFENTFRARIQMMKSVDEMVEGLVKTLEATGELENTYIFFTSDNGFHIGQHRMDTGKLSAYEEDIRVPMLVRGPSIQPGMVVDAITGNVDLAATFADIAQVDTLLASDGRSLLPLLHGKLPEVEWRKAYLIERWPLGSDEIEDAQEFSEGILEPPDPNEMPDLSGEVQTTPAYKGLRTLEYAYFEYETGEFELYDMLNDPYQLNNIFSSADPQWIMKLSDTLKTLSECQGDGCWLASIPKE